MALADMRMGRRRAAVLLVGVVVAGCSSDSGSGDEATSANEQPGSTVTTSAGSVATTTTSLPAPSEHRIGVRLGDDGPEFYDVETGDTWVARGFNHWRWVNQGGFLMDRTFRAGNNDLVGAMADLENMAERGYNAVRIWFSACFDSAPGCFVEGDEAIRQAYLENVAEYLRKARDLGIYVLFTVDDAGGERYNTSKAGYAGEFEGFNLQDLTTGGIEDQMRFWEDVVGGLIEVGAPLDAIWAYELRNEQFLEANKEPFSSGAVVTTASGETYDLSDGSEVQRIESDGIAYWAQTLARTIKALDPTALVTIGFFPSGQGPVTFGDPDPRLVDPHPYLTVDEVDFLDFHAYPGLGPGGWDTVWANSLLDADIGKPIVLGEIGAFHSAYDTVDEAIASQTSWLARACQLGFDGYLYWTWTNLGIYTETWDAVAEDGAIAEALSPETLPDPCEAPPPATGNLAYGKMTTASLFESTDEFYAPPSNAVDGSDDTWWTAPDAGPQWIEIDLGSPATVERLRLLTELGADSPLRVVVSLQDEDRAQVAQQELSSDGSSSPLTLEHSFTEPPQGVRYVRVTTYRDGWIIWHEIEVYGSQ